MKRSSRVYLIILILAAFCSSHLSYGQGKHSSSWYDSITYNRYLLGNWSSVVNYGKEALSSGFDYYYLRMRLGAAFYEQGNYRNAINQYNKALSFNAGDTFAKEMKYYSYLNIGDRDLANFVSAGFQKDRKKALKINTHNFLDYFYLESGVSASSSQGISVRLLSGNDSIYGEEDLNRNLFYAHFGGRFRIKPSLSVYAGYTRMTIEKEKRFEYSITGMRRDSVKEELYGKSYHYSFPRVFNDTAFDYRVTQNDIYLNASCLPAEGWKITPALHYFQVQSHKILSSYQITTKTDTAGYNAFNDSVYFFNYHSDSYTFDQKDTLFSNYVLSLSVTRELGNFTLEVHGSLSDFNLARQYQAGTSVTWFPFGNTSLYSTTMATTLFGNNLKKKVYEQTIGFRIAKYLWLSGFATLGNLDLYNEKNGYVVYNQSDPVTFRTGADALLILGKRLELNLMYRYCRKEYQSLKYALGIPPIVNPLLISVFTTNTYSNQSFIGGIKWKL